MSNATARVASGRICRQQHILYRAFGGDCAGDVRPARDQRLLQAFFDADQLGSNLYGLVETDLARKGNLFAVQAQSELECTTRISAL